jgi:hypothetical protein
MSHPRVEPSALFARLTVLLVARPNAIIARGAAFEVLASVNDNARTEIFKQLGAL